MKKVYAIIISTVISLSGISQNWLFTKPFYQQNSPNTSDGYSPGKIKRLQTGNLIRYSSDENRAVLQGYNASGDSLWYYKIKHLYISDATVIGDNAFFCGWLDSAIALQNQVISCPDTCVYGIYGIINSNGIFSSVKLVQGKQVKVRSISHRNNIFCLAGGYKGYAMFETTTITGSDTIQAFVAKMDNNFNIERIGYTSAADDASASASACSIDGNGNIWVVADTYHQLQWHGGSSASTFSSGTTWGGQQLLKLNANLTYIWDKVLFMGIGPEYYESPILTDSNSAVIASLYHWGSGAGTHTAIRKFAADGSEAWSKTFNSAIAIVGTDVNSNIYSCSSDNSFTLYKFAQDGTQLYAVSDTTWKQRIFEWDFAGPDEFYGLGSCDNNSNNCIAGRWFLTHYKMNTVAGVQIYQQV